MDAADNTEDFFGRGKELLLLEQVYSSKKTEFYPIYGRRRVGKSQLILQFIKNKKALYFLGKKSTAPLQIKDFLEEAARAFEQPLLASQNITDWKTALKIALEQKPSGKKLVLVFDEFQWIVEASPELPSILQEFLDRDWKQKKDILLILCGSYLGFMEKEVLGEKSPLFGRRTGQILLKPFSYREAGQFHSSWSIHDQAKAYFICGGIPLYLNFFNERHSVYKNIENNFMNEYSPLYREPDFLLREELRELSSYYAILMLLSSGANTSKDIAKEAGIDERKIYYYIQNLAELGYVKRHSPLTGAKIPAKSVKFILADPLLLFWFRFVYPHMGYVSQVGPRESFLNLVKPNLDQFFGKRFEILCREALALIYTKESTIAPFEIGEFWNKQVQIDVVGYKKNERIDICECKWGKISSGESVVKELLNKISKYPNPLGLTLRGRIFSQYPIKIKNAPKNIEFHCLEEIYNLL